jgi:hypothetical protein
MDVARDLLIALGIFVSALTATRPIDGREGVPDHAGREGVGFGSYRAARL